MFPSIEMPSAATLLAALQLEPRRVTRPIRILMARAIEAIFQTNPIHYVEHVIYQVLTNGPKISRARSRRIHSCSRMNSSPSKLFAPSASIDTCPGLRVVRCCPTTSTLWAHGMGVLVLLRARLPLLLLLLLLQLLQCCNANVRLKLV